MPEDGSRLLLVDGHALIHRAFHALPELTTSTGELVNAVFGFTSMLLKALETERPSNVLMAMDRPVPTFRHREYAEYKAQRPPTPRPLVSQFDRVREVAAAMHVPIYEKDGYEADDVLGTLARQAEERSIAAVILTGDLDALQLVTEDVHVLTPRRGMVDTRKYDVAGVQERLGIGPAQVPDWKALVGDTSDNIPGVKGIGEKTATRLLDQYGSLDALFEHLHELPEKVRDALLAERDQVFQSRRLATIVRDVPVHLSLDGSAFGGIDRTALLRLFNALEFQSLVGRVQALAPAPRVPVPVAPGSSSAQLSMFEVGPDSQAPPVQQVQQNGRPYVTNSLESGPSTLTRVVDDEGTLTELVHELQAAGTWSVDTETTATDPLRADLVGLSFATRTGSAWYIPVGHFEGQQIPLVDVLGRLRPLLESAEQRKVAHNLKYDWTVLQQHGITLRGLYFDTMIAAYLINPSGRGLSLSALSLSRLNREMTPIETLIGRGKQQGTMASVPIATAASYAGDDADVTLQLMHLLEPDLRERELVDLFQHVEMPLVEVLARMELAGVSLDTASLAAMSASMTGSIGELERRIYDAAGRPFNINSTQQLAQVLFVQLELPSGRRTKSGFSTDTEVLEGLRGRHPIVDDILEYRRLIKLKNTYVDALPALINPRTGRIHTDFNQTIASTGRLSSSNPNLQNIPNREDIGRQIRRAFVPSASTNVLLAADYSQIELRILASMSGDERLLDAFLAGEDIHRATASAVFGVPLPEVTSDQRRIAKVVNFGIIYGIGEARLAYETGISRQEAADFIGNYNATYAGVKAFMDGVRRAAYNEGYVTTLLGRRRYVPEIHSSNPGMRQAAERAAINMPVQGTAADIIKLAMIRLDRYLAEAHPESRMVLQVHDELVFDTPRSDVAQVASQVKRHMESALELRVPLEVEMKVGRDWYDMETFVVAD